MTIIVSAAELANRQYAKDKGIETLIAWFKAELALQDVTTVKCYGVHEDELLAQHQEHIEVLAKGWRANRLTAASAATG